jgi:glycerate kinase
MKIVVAPNAFKGSLNAPEAAAAMAAGISQAFPDIGVVQIPVADGGDGLLEVVAAALRGERRRVTVTSPRGTPIDAEIFHVKPPNLVVVEMALASGLALLPPSMQDPARTSTFGTGELIRAGLNLGAERIAIGIGGSATNDGGTGMAEALGVRFLDADGDALPGIGASLEAIADIDLSGLDPRIEQTTIEAVCDVENPLFGPNGAATVYAPQKGATPTQVAMLDRGLENLARVIKDKMNADVADLPGAGAAGGLGAGLCAFLGAKLRKGIDLVFDLVGLEAKLAGAALVLTGEGRIDFQTAYGKAPGGVGAVAKKHGIPCIAIAGSIGDNIDGLHDSGITALFALPPGPLTLEAAMVHAKAHLARSTEQVVRAFLAGR